MGWSQIRQAVLLLLPFDDGKEEVKAVAIAKGECVLPSRDFVQNITEKKLVGFHSLDILKNSTVNLKQTGKMLFNNLGL